MAQRRMFSKKITETDAFLDMPMSSQCLYFHLNMSADDDGFIGNAKTIKRMIGASDDDLKLLLTKEFLIPFESGVVVIKDWKIHNYIRKDTYNETHYTQEKQQIEEVDNGSYTLRGRSVDDSSPQVRLGKDRLGKDRLNNTSSGDDDASEAFEEWWNLYNKKVEKKKAFKRFKICYKKDGLEKIMDGTRSYLKTVSSKQYQKNPTTFLNGDIYLDKEGFDEMAKEQVNQYKPNKPQGTPNPYADNYQDLPF